MGFFGGKSKDANAPTAPGAHYVGGTNDENLPVATPIEAAVVASNPYAGSLPPMKESYTTTTVYAPDGSIKQSHVTSTDLTVGQTPMKQTFVTTIPPPTRGPYDATMTREVLLPGFRRAPARMQSCPACTQASRTQVRTHPTIATWIAVVILLFLFWPICWIPLVCDVFKQTDHYCSHCGGKVAEITPFQDCCEKRRG